MAVKEKFDTLTERMNTNPEHLGSTNILYTFDLSGEEEGTYHLHIKDQSATYSESVEEESDITLIMKDKDFIKLSEGNLNPTMAYMSGKLKIKGDLGKAMKLQTLLNHYA
ncbi:SCP2 sterol-binding domain-containing protein [Alteribacter aurantiacus]|uniref:SCP2 sterol-binding domain-containing protein n=1 Tax=Alteribacter aurantiacus TaxID=254410 RepID=UPI0003F78EE3|nr:SCP2 sterol-binding domain-containing protein [Alteribacter aurantiacus]